MNEVKKICEQISNRWKELGLPGSPLQVNIFEEEYISFISFEDGEVSEDG